MICINPPCIASFTNRIPCKINLFYNFFSLYSRVSIPFFFEPNFDTVIEPLDVCLKKTGDKKHDAVVYGEHLVGKVSKNFDL